MHTIKIRVEGGVIEDIGPIPPGVRIEVRDYDVEGVDEDRIDTDLDGDECVLSIWHPETTEDSI